jgi:hypothetical protein
MEQVSTFLLGSLLLAEGCLVDSAMEEGLHGEALPGDGHGVVVTTSLLDREEVFPSPSVLK